MEVSIQAVSPELGVQFSSVLASQAGGGGGAAATGGAAGAGTAVWASAAPIGRETSASTTSAAATRRQTEPFERATIRTLPSQVRGRPLCGPPTADSDRLRW